MLTRLFRRKPPLPEIDAVYTWVDGSNPVFRAQVAEQQQRYLVSLGHPPEPEAVAARRFRDMDNLRHSLRSLEKNGPSFRRILIVTNRQTPRWLRRESRAEIVTLDEIFTDAGDLPTFNAAAIEWNIPRIPGLSRHYMQINDDCFFAKPVPLEYFFGNNGLPKLMLDRYALQEEPKDETLWQRLMSHQAALLRERFGEHVYYQPAHGPIVIDREALSRVAALWPDGIRTTSRHRFREAFDLHLPALYANALAAMDAGKASRERHEKFTPSERELRIIQVGHPDQPWQAQLDEALRRPPRLLCLNDDAPSEYCGGIERSHREFLARLFPEASSFESETPPSGGAAGNT